MSSNATGNQIATKQDVTLNLVKLLFHERTDRGMTLIPEQSRCVRAGEVHELVTTDQRDLRPGDRVDRVGFLGFGEVEAAGVVDAGDSVLVDGQRIGVVVGFDACHFPNHYNLLVATNRLHTGGTLSLAVGGRIRFVQGVTPTES
jgi:hypothetical protein